MTNINEQLAHKIATKIYEKTGVAVSADDPTVLLTLAIADVLEDLNNKTTDKIDEFVSVLENVTDKTMVMDENINRFTLATKQLILANAQKEIEQTINKSIKKLPDIIEKNTRSNLKNNNIFVIIILLIQIVTLSTTLFILLR